MSSLAGVALKMARPSGTVRFGTVLWMGAVPMQCLAQGETGRCGMPLLAVPLFVLLTAAVLAIQLLLIAILKHKRGGLLRALGGIVALGGMLWSAQALLFVFLPDLKAWEGTSAGFSSLLVVDVLLNVASFGTGLYLLTLVRRRPF